MITIGKAIYSILYGNLTVKNYVNNKIYPLVIPENTLLPCIVYERSSDIEYSRDGSGISSNTLEITILSEDYSESINISLAVFSALHKYNGIIQDIRILDSRLIGIDETYAEGSYIQKLTFLIKAV